MRRDLVVIGASAGGLPALYTILGGLPRALPAAVVVVVHTRATNGVLPQILARRSNLPVEAAGDRVGLQSGRVYVAPADRHVLITRGGLRVVRGPRENGFRPAIDPLFRTAARARGRRVIGVILSGGLDDGSYGLGAIVNRGGAAIVQDPRDAEIDSMPLAALQQAEVDAVLPASEIADAIVRFTGESVDEEETAMPREEMPEPQRQAGDTHPADMEEQLGAPSPITCPACGGALWESDENGVVRYACHVGHQYAPDSLLAEHGEAVEHALWSAVRVLEQHAELRLRMARRAEGAGLNVVAEGFTEDAREYQRQGQEIRRLVFGDRERVTAGEAVRGRARAR